jgi:hypothetical protein
MTAITYNGAVPTVGADADVWGGKINIAFGQIKVDLEMLNTAPTARFLGRTTAGTGEVERLTAAQAAAMLPALVGDAGSGGTKGLVPAPAAGDAAAGKVLKADGTWGLSNVIRAWGLFTGSTGAAVAASNLSCVRTGESLFAFTFGAPLANANYALFIQPTGDNLIQPAVYSKSASGFSIQVLNSLGGLDPDQINVAVVSA